MMFLAKPLDVDVVSTPWDYIVDAADIFAGLGTLGALIVAVLVYRRQVDDARRSQAARIIPHLVSGYKESPTYIYTVKNFSDLPIFDLHVDFAIEQMGKIRPAVNYHSFKLNQDEGFSMEVEGNRRGSSVGLPPEKYAVSFRFIDAAGRRWKRDETGALSQIRFTLRRQLRWKLAGWRMRLRR